MTRLAIISDVHADVHAVEDALAQAERLGCSRVVCAGDLVDYGLFPDETIALLRARAIPCIRGNHDRWRVAERNGEHAADAGGSGAELNPETIRFLAELPTAWNAELAGVRVALRHGTPRSDMTGIYPADATLEDVQRWLREAHADVLVVGHTHQPFALAALGGGLIANPGALLRSANDKPSLGFDLEHGHYTLSASVAGGTFGILELPARRFTVHLAADGSEIEVPRLTLGVRDRR